MQAHVSILLALRIYLVNLVESPVGQRVEEGHMRHEALDHHLVRDELVEDLSDGAIVHVESILTF